MINFGTCVGLHNTQPTLLLLNTYYCLFFYSLGSVRAYKNFNVIIMLFANDEEISSFLILKSRYILYKYIYLLGRRILEQINFDKFLEICDT